MKLYYSRGACSLASRIIVHETGLECDYVSVNLRTKKTEDDQNYLEINPKGAVPTLALDDGAILTENAIILQYLAEKSHSTELLPPVNDFKRYRVLEWLNFIASDLHKGFGTFFHPTLSQEVKEKIFMPAMQQKLAYINSALNDKKYLMGNDFTLPDAYLFVILTWAHHFKFNFDEVKNVERYFNALHERESIKTALKEERIK